MVDLSRLLVPEETGEGCYRGPTGPSFGSRLFGGQAFAQALMAASLAETGGRLAHSAHGYFLKAGAAADPLDLSVQTLTEGRSFATRRVEASQGEGTIFTMVASYHRAEEGWQHAAEVVPPIGPETAQQRLAEWIDAQEDPQMAKFASRLTERPVELVPFDPATVFGNGRTSPASGWWMRMREPVTDDPALKRAVLAYASDMMFLRTSLLPHGIRPASTRVQAASLDHAIWFHETPEVSDWLAFVTESPWAAHARGLNRGYVVNRDGVMIATVMQENLMRPRDGPG